MKETMPMFSEKNFMKGGEITEQDKKETYKKWKDLLNMSASELKKFMDSDEGKEAGLSKQEADKLGIHYGRESAKWILKMKDTPNSEWTPEMWRWAKRQISFNSRMRGNKGKLYDDKGRKTRKHLSLLIWGHNPEKYQEGGNIYKNTFEQDIKEYTLFVKKQIEDEGYYVSSPIYSKNDFGYSNYLLVSKKITDENKIKVRISDHSVTNLYRMFNEIHLHYPPYENEIFSLKRAIKDLDFRLNRSKYFKEEEAFEEYVVKMEVNENGLRPTDKVLSERLSTAKRGAGRRIFNIERINKKNVINWIDIRDGKIFKTLNKYKNGGEVILAPNGKPSNLTPEQYKLVRTKEFKDWFGDWENNKNKYMLLDENDEPYIMYHTGGEWNELDTNRGGLMFSFTSKSMAYGKADLGRPQITRQFFIKSDFIYKVKYEERNIAKNTKNVRSNQRYKYPVYFVNAYGGFIIVHKPEQIKLADGTNTTFDGSNPDIRFNKGGEITLTPEQIEQKLGRKLHWWNDDVVSINGVEYKKVFLKSEYKRLYALGGEVNIENPSTDKYNDIFINGEKVGYIILSPARKEYYWLDINLPNPLAIVDIKILKEFRGKNYMTQTMNWLFNFAKENGHKSLFLRVDDNSEISQETLYQIYSKYGFSTYKTSDDDDIFMYKLL